jgi:hypothetical protein
MHVKLDKSNLGAQKLNNNIFSFSFIIAPIQTFSELHTTINKYLLVFLGAKN